jgi:hypothetical protein
MGRIVQDVEDSPPCEGLEEGEAFEDGLDLHLCADDADAEEAEWGEGYATKKGQGMRKTLMVSMFVTSMIARMLTATSPILSASSSTP